MAHYQDKYKLQSCAILSATDIQTLLKYVIVTKCEFRQTSNQKS